MTTVQAEKIARRKNLGEAGLATVPFGGHLSGDYRSTTRGVIFEKRPTNTRVKDVK